MPNGESKASPLIAAMSFSVSVEPALRIAAAAAIRKAGSTDTEKLIAAMSGLAFDSPFGKVSFRALDHQSTMGAYVGRTAVKDGKGVMVDWRYADGSGFLPSDDTVKRLRPQD